MKWLTDAQIHRRKCIRCGAKGHAQWQICADGNRPRVLCIECDIRLNRMVVYWIGFKDAKAKMKRYTQRLKP